MIKTSTGFAEQSKKTNTLYKPMILYNGKQIPDEVQDFVYEGTVADSASFSFGTACSQKCSFSINNPTENLTGKELEVKYGTMVNGKMEYIRLGYFTCLKPEIDRGVATYTLMDRMSVKMGMPYFPTVKAPTTDIDILKDICKQSGVALSSKALGKSHTVSSIPNGYTYREMLCYIAQMQGCNAVINSDGEVELRWYASVDYVLDDAHIYANGAAHVDAETPFSVGYVACIVRDPSGKKEDIELRSGTGAAGITLENPMMTQAILDDVYSRVSKMSFYPAEFEFCGDFRLELGDIVSVVTGGENYNMAVMEITHKCSYGLVTTISSVAQTDAEDGLDQQSPVTKEMDRYYANLVTINKALINKLDVETAKITYATIKDLQAETAKIDKLEADKITVDQLDANYARIDKANIGTGWIDSAMIGEGVVGTVQIADGSITDAKIVSLTANKLTAGRIDAGEIEVVNLKAENITVGKINGKQIAEGSISSENLGESSVTTEKVSDGAITERLIAADAVTAEKIVAEAITAREIATNAITSNKILAGAVTADKIDVADLFAQELTATNLKVTGESTLSGVSATDLTVSGESSFNGDITAKTLKLLQDGLTFDFSKDTNGLSIKYTNPDKSGKFAQFNIGENGINFTEVNDFGNVMFRTIHGDNTCWTNLSNSSGLLSIGGAPLIVQGHGSAKIRSTYDNGDEGSGATFNGDDAYIGAKNGVQIDGKKMSDKSDKPIYTRTVSGEWVRYTMRLPDSKVQIAWMYWGTSQVINTAWGSGYQSRQINMGNWEKPFNSLHSFSYSVGVDENMDNTDCWLSCYRSANLNEAGQYFINRQSALATSLKYWIYVIGIGTYE